MLGVLAMLVSSIRLIATLWIKLGVIAMLLIMRGVLTTFLFII